MLDPMHMFRDGGPFMYPILMGAMLVPFLVLATGVLAALRIRVPAALHLALGTCLLPLGIFGTLMGYDLLDRAVANASAEMVTRLTAMGTQVGLYTLLFGAAVTTLALPAMALAMAIGGAIGIKERTLTVLHGGAVVPLVLASIGFLAARSGGGMGVVLLTVPAVALIAAFASTDPIENERVASLRATVGWLVPLSSASLAVTVSTNAAIAYCAAQPTESPDHRQALIDFALGSFQLSGGAALGGVFAGLLATALLTGPLFTALLRPRTAISAVVAGLALLPTLGMLAWVGSRTATYHEQMIPAGEVRLAVLDTLGVRLPVAEANSLERQVAPYTSLTFQSDGTVLLDDAPIPPGPLPDRALQDGLNIEAAADTPLSALLAFPLEGARKVEWVVATDRGLRAIELKPQGRGDDFREVLVSGFAAEIDGDTARFAREESGTFETVHQVPAAELVSSIHRMRDAYPDESDLHLWVPETTTVQDLVSIVDGFIQAEEGGIRDPLWVHWRTDPPPNLPVPAPVDPNDAGEGTVGTGRFEVLGSLDRDVIQRTVRRYAGQMKYCYERELVKDPTLSATLLLKFVIAADGSVSSAAAKRSSGNADLDRCAIEKAKRWRFPEPRGGGIVIVTYPFVFGTK
jgi:TonB family protein